jgi:hypothetical protein
VLVEEREPVELRRRNDDLEVVAGPCAILDGKLDRVWERLLEKRVNRVRFHPGHASHAGYPDDVRFLRALFFFKLGFWAGALSSAALLKRMLPSLGDAGSDEVALVAIFDGIELQSHSTAFRGGSMLSWFGGIAVDMRSAKLAPDAHLTVHALFGGIAIRVPPGWRVESTVRALGGGVAVDTPRLDDQDAPRLLIDGMAILGGVAVGAKAAEARPGS